MWWKPEELSDAEVLRLALKIDPYVLRQLGLRRGEIPPPSHEKFRRFADKIIGVAIKENLRGSPKGKPVGAHKPIGAMMARLEQFSFHRVNAEYFRTGMFFGIIGSMLVLFLAFAIGSFIWG